MPNPRKHPMLTRPSRLLLPPQLPHFLPHSAPPPTDHTSLRPLWSSYNRNFPPPSSPNSLSLLPSPPPPPSPTPPSPPLTPLLPPPVTTGRQQRLEEPIRTHPRLRAQAERDRPRHDDQPDEPPVLKLELTHRLMASRRSLQLGPRPPLPGAQERRHVHRSFVRPKVSLRCSTYFMPQRITSIALLPDRLHCPDRYGRPATGTSWSRLLAWERLRRRFRPPCITSARRESDQISPRESAVQKHALLERVAACWRTTVLITVADGADAALINVQILGHASDSQGRPDPPPTLPRRGRDRRRWRLLERYRGGGLRSAVEDTASLEDARSGRPDPHAA